MARKSAEERREEIVGIAFRHFADGGYNGTSTEDIAREAGISQPYLFRLFRTKKELFLACSDRCYEQISGVFAAAAVGDTPEERMSAMGHAYEAELQAAARCRFTGCSRCSPRDVPEGVGRARASPPQLRRW